MMLGVPLLLLGVVASACAGDDAGSGSGGNASDDIDITVSAEIVEADVSASVEASEIETGDYGRLTHEVRLTWEGESPASFSDARFTHIVEGDTDGALVTAGRGCDAQWDEERNDVLHMCNGDLRIVWLEPGDTHEYPVHIRTEVGPRELTPGTYVVDEPIRWAHSDEAMQPLAESEEQQFTVRLTYVVE